jgi:hypothetical protein
MRTLKKLLRYYLCLCVSHPLWILLLYGIVTLFSAPPIHAQVVEPDWTQYNLKFPPPPPDGNNAAATVTQRTNILIEFVACGEEDVFLEATLRGLGKSAKKDGNIPDPAQFYADGFLDIVMAKLQWVKLGQPGCNSTFNAIGDFYDKDDFKNETQIKAWMVAIFGRVCKDATEAVVAGASVSGPFFNQVKSVISAECLKAQINYVLNQVQEGDTYPGSDPLPCDIVGTHKGDWDVRMKSLIRILFLDSVTHGDPGVGSVLSIVRPDGRTTREYIQEDLITVDGGPGQNTYSWTACGDNEKDTGSPQDREDENSSSSDFWDSVGDVLTWFFRRLLLIVLLLTVAWVIAAWNAITGVAAGVISVVGVAGILAGRIPETENHRLMIESTRFLNNQLIIQALGAGNAPAIGSDQSDVKDWLLNKFHDVAENDFVEYNARPYQGYSLAALRNLADFSTDLDVRNGAQMLLEYSAAKFAVGSNQGRRLVPFRRRLPAVRCMLGQDCGTECYIHPGCHTTPPPPDEWHPWFEIFHTKAFGDEEVSLALLFNGQTQQLMNGMAPEDGLDVPAATSEFAIDPLIADIAIRKDVAYFQRIHHSGYETYSSSASALITAGGIETDHANHIMLGPIPIHTPGDPTQDIGAGLPTTVMFTGGKGVTDEGQSRMTIGNFITFQGNLKTEGSDESFTDNLCVWRNFVCGVNLHLPTDIAQCLVPTLNQEVPHWFFFDSLNSLHLAGCDGYSTGPHFFLVLYIICPQNRCSVGGVPPNSDGFIEVVDNPSDRFDVFQAKVRFGNLSNPDGDLGKLGQGCFTGDDCKGRYHTFAGDNLDLEVRGHQDDSDKTGITAVNGVNEKDIHDWNFAEGDIVSSQGDAVITIKNPRLGTELILDFSSTNHPCRRTGPSQPCTQQ